MVVEICRTVGWAVGTAAEANMREELDSPALKPQADTQVLVSHRWGKSGMEIDLDTASSVCAAARHIAEAIHRPVIIGGKCSVEYLCNPSKARISKETPRCTKQANSKRR
jgi:hypothetical protein